MIDFSFSSHTLDQLEILSLSLSVFSLRWNFTKAPFRFDSSGRKPLNRKSFCCNQFFLLRSKSLNIFCLLGGGCCSWSDLFVSHRCLDRKGKWLMIFRLDDAKMKFWGRKRREFDWCHFAFYDVRTALIRLFRILQFSLRSDFTSARKFLGSISLSRCCSAYSIFPRSVLFPYFFPSRSGVNQKNQRGRGAKSDLLRLNPFKLSKIGASGRRRLNFWVVSCGEQWKNVNSYENAPRTARGLLKKGMKKPPG